jgi:hypothetical protein
LAQWESEKRIGEAKRQMMEERYEVKRRGGVGIEGRAREEWK